MLSRIGFSHDKSYWYSLLVLCGLLFIVFPLGFDLFRLNLVGKYLTYAFVAVGLVLCWGYGGILSLGQGVFFGLGGYLIAMFLKLEASDVVITAKQNTPGIPDFMDWNQLTALPWFWQPFYSLTFTVLAIPILPVVVASLIGLAMFTRRVGGVYFAIITQSLAAILSILIIGQQGLCGGINGITDLRTLKGWDINSDTAKYVFYFINATLLVGVLAFSKFLLESKLGRLLVAIRDKEDRVRFSGYDVAHFKVFIFALAALFAAIGGAMFTLQVGFISPSFVGIVPSIEMVIFCAVAADHQKGYRLYVAAFQTTPGITNRHPRRSAERQLFRGRFEYFPRLSVVERSSVLAAQKRSLVQRAHNSLCE